MSDIEKLLAIEEIRRLKAAYFRCLDTKDWQGLGALFTEDATFDIRDDIPDCILKGAVQIVDGAKTSFTRGTSVHHGHCPEIEITSDTTAKGIWAMEDMLWWDEDASPRGIRTLHGYGHYHETYKRIGGRWLIGTMKLKRLRVDLTRTGTTDEPRAR